ncbi:hypothetical protein F2Q68_00003392 [Brassica cretica]|uniref:Uncharacterized protein n=2 Tax=Brassica cretica TaxID=69181 RepID=A0ABQ7C7J1_BRACR|nr:hypothetical protein F2Q68_00003392 [Brassica cretica]KAF3547258.1 hypothetical protein DY000_02005284 [Brassica cretica]
MLLLSWPDTVADAPISLLPCTSCTTMLQNLLSDHHVAALMYHFQLVTHSHAL